MDPFSTYFDAFLSFFMQ